MTGGQTLSDREIFQRAVQMPADQRAAYMDAACGGNAELRREVESLIKAHDTCKSFMEMPALQLRADEDAFTPRLTEGPGTVIGPYKLREQIGEGGMGVVFMAEQTEPIQRTVALKIIKPGMDTRQVIARFEAERQAVAMMDHPNIAKVLDAGTTNVAGTHRVPSPEAVGQAVPDKPTSPHASQAQPDLRYGRPYFVMELVKGVPITKYCDEKLLPIRARLELFMQVCQAVQHAHQKGIIHRDIKPNNVLVAEYDNHAVPKVIDFGVAKATASKLTERTMFTEFGQVLGTMEYMSPEQSKFNQLDIDTRSDIYSLGVLLYELLTGSTPFERERLREAAFDEVLRIIREVEPPKPSTRLSNRHTPCAVAADGTRSVPATTSLASIAVNRHTEPARLSKDVRGELDWIVMKCLEKDRNRRYSTASALADDILRYLDDEPVTAGPPSRIYRASKFVRRNKWQVVAFVAVLIGLIAGMIGMAIALQSQSRQRLVAERERAEAQLNLAVALQFQSKFGEAEDLYRLGMEYLAGGTAEDRQRAAHTLFQLGKVATNNAATERLYREGLAAYRAAYPPGNPSIAHALTTLALFLREHRRHAEAEPFLREAYDIYHQAAPSDHFQIGVSALHLGAVLSAMDKPEEAEPLLRESIAEYQLVAPQNELYFELYIAWARVELGRVLALQGKRAEAETEFLQALKVLESTSGVDYVAIGLTGLYTTWDQAEPGKGYDAKAQEWTRKVIEEFYHPATITGGEKTKSPASKKK